MRDVPARAVNARQREVLRRIVGGQEPVTRRKGDLVGTVNALVTRRLIQKQKVAGGGWVAVATDAGREYLAGLDGSPPPPPAAPAPAVTPDPPQVEQAAVPDVPAGHADGAVTQARELRLTYSVDEAAEMLGVGRGWLRVRAQQRDVPHVRLGRRIRFTLDQMLALIDACSVEPLPNAAFNNPWGLVPGSHSLRAARDWAAAEQQARRDPWIRSPRAQAARRRRTS
jgi:excisionase family DNA binding protein